MDTFCIGGFSYGLSTISKDILHINKKNVKKNFVQMAHVTVGSSCQNYIQVKKKIKY